MAAHLQYYANVHWPTCIIGASLLLSLSMAVCHQLCSYFGEIRDARDCFILILQLHCPG